MKFIKNKIFLLFISTASLIGCNEDDFLTKVNPNAYDVSVYYTKESDFNSTLTTVYGALQFHSVSGRDLVPEMLQGDFAWAAPFSRTTLQFQDFNYNDTDGAIQSKWQELYIGINRANQVLAALQNADDALFADGNKVLIEAQARYLRAFFYFQLVSTYNQAIIHTDRVTSVEEANKGLSTRDEVNTQVIIPDLEFAQANLPETWDEDQLGRVTWGAATSLLGKLYLYEKEWQLAAAEFTKVYNSNIYSLPSNYEDNFRHTSPFTSESIFEVPFSYDFAEGANGVAVDDTPGGNPGAEASGLGNAVAKPGYGGGFNILPGYQLTEMFEADSLADGSGLNSPRLKSTIVPYNFEGEFYGVTDPLDTQGVKWNIGTPGYVKKHTNWYWLDVEPELNRSGLNFIHIRFADVILMYAEALLEDGTNEGNVPQAISLIDEVRARAGVVTLQSYMADNGGQIPQFHITRVGVPQPARVFVAPSAQTVLTHLQRVERPLELAFEGHRWKDLVRWDIALDVIRESQAYEANLTLDANRDFVFRNENAPFYTRNRLNEGRDRHFTEAVKATKARYYWPVPNTEVQANDAL